MIGLIIELMNDPDNVVYYGTAETSLSIIANVMLVTLHLYPVPTFCRMLRDNSTGEVQPYHYMITTVNCMLWASYAMFIIPELPSTPFYGLCLALSNTIGFLLSIFYNLIFSEISHEKNTEDINLKYCIVMVVLFVPVCIIIWMTMMVGRDFRFLGPLCVVSGISMHAISPLFLIRNAYKRKNVESLPYGLCIANVLNGIIWVIYVSVSPVFNIYMAITNGVGTILGIYNLLVCYKLHASPQNFSTHPKAI